MNAREERLMRLLDGDLEGAEAEAARAEADAAPEARAEERAGQALGVALRDHFSAAADEAKPDLDRVWRRLDHRIAEEALQPTGIVARVLAFVTAHRGTFATAAASGLAGALVMALALPRPQTALDVTRATIAPPTTQPVLASRAAEVESLEVSGGTGMVVTIPAENANEAATTVIWVTHDEKGPI